MSACVVCAVRESRGGGFCPQCARSWDKDARECAGDMSSVVEWTANRVRWFERKRAREERLQLLARLERIEKEVRGGE
jgi:hypothetical protein